MTNIRSDFFTLNQRDAFRGVLVAGLSAVLMSLITVLNSGALPTVPQLQQAGIAGLSAGLAYLTKNLFTNSNGQMGKKE